MGLNKKQPIRCGSAHCREKHAWIFEGTDQERLETRNCYGQGYSQAKIDLLNSLPDLFDIESQGKYKHIWEMD
jgi:hypothetical protein